VLSWWLYEWVCFPAQKCFPFLCFCFIYLYVLRTHPPTTITYTTHTCIHISISIERDRSRSSDSSLSKFSLWYIHHLIIIAIIYTQWRHSIIWRIIVITKKDMDGFYHHYYWGELSYGVYYHRWWWWPLKEPILIVKGKLDLSEEGAEELFPCDELYLNIRLCWCVCMCLWWT
jgi:hypothetical protein